MPSGRVHAAISTGAAALLLAAGYAAGQPGEVNVALGSGCLAGIILTPDLDVDEGSHSHYEVRRHVGRDLARLWYLFWLPYARLMPHRSWLSHAPVIGTLLRLAYIGLIIFLITSLFGYHWSVNELPSWGWWALIGLAISDGLHWVADFSITHLKRLARMILRL